MQNYAPSVEAPVIIRSSDLDCVEVAWFAPLCADPTWHWSRLKLNDQNFPTPLQSSLRLVAIPYLLCALTVAAQVAETPAQPEVK